MRVSLILAALVVFFVAGVLYYQDEPIEISTAGSCAAFPQTNFVKVPSKILGQKPWEITYLFRLDYGSSNDLDFIATSLGEDPHLRYIKHMGEGKFVEDKNFPAIPTAHARDLAAFKLNGKKAFAVTDHGFDKPPFDGGQPLLVVHDGKAWKDQTKKLFPKIKTFNFTLTDLDLDQKELVDLYLASVSQQTGNSVLLQNNGKNRFTISNRLPAEFKHPDFCYMTIRKLGLHEGAQYFFLGGCDGPENSVRTPRDRIMKVEKGTISLLPENSLPVRLKTPRWGTVAAVVGDINKDGFADIVAATHNFGYTEGGLQVYLNSGKDWAFTSPEESFYQVSEDGKPGYLPFVKLGDIDGDGYPELIAPHVGIFKNDIDPKINNKFVLLKNKQDGNFQNVTSCLQSALYSVMAAEILDIDQDGRLDILLVSYNGDIEIFYNRAKKD